MLLSRPWRSAILGTSKDNHLESPASFLARLSTTFYATLSSGLFHRSSPGPSPTSASKRPAFSAIYFVYFEFSITRPALLTAYSQLLVSGTGRQWNQSAISTNKFVLKRNVRLHTSLLAAGSLTLAIYYRELLSMVYLVESLVFS